MPKSCEGRIFPNLQMLGRVWRSHRHSDWELRWKLQAPSPHSTRKTRWMSSGYRNLWMFVDDGPMHQPSPWMMTMTMLAGAVQLHAWWASEWHLELATLPPLYKQQAAEEHQIQSAEASSNVQKLLLCCRHEDKKKHRADLQHEHHKTEYRDQETISEVKLLMNRPTHVLWVVSTDITFKALCVTETATEIWLRVMWAQESFRNGNWNASSIRKGLLPFYATWPTTWMPRNLRSFL